MAPVWISHRGYKAQAVENTAEAFRAAVALGFPVLETDLRVSADGHIVLHHDPNLLRLAGTDAEVSTLTRRELEAVRLSSGGLSGRLLFLDQFAEEFADRGWIFDVKPDTGERTLRVLFEWTKAKGMSETVRRRARFLLWNTTQQRRLLATWPDAVCLAREVECWRAGLSVIAGTPAFGGIERGKTYALPPRLGKIELFERSKAEAFHRRGARVLAFLPESEEDTAKALAAGFDEILTNGSMPA